MSLSPQFARGVFPPPATLLGAAFYAFLFMTIAWFLSRMVRLTVRRFQHLLIDQTVSTLLIRLAQVVIYVMAAILYTHAIPQFGSVGAVLLTLLPAIARLGLQRHMYDLEALSEHCLRRFAHLPGGAAVGKDEMD